MFFSNFFLHILHVYNSSIARDCFISNIFEIESFNFELFWYAFFIMMLINKVEYDGKRMFAMVVLSPVDFRIDY